MAQTLERQREYQKAYRARTQKEKRIYNAAYNAKNGRMLAVRRAIRKERDPKYRETCTVYYLRARLKKYGLTIAEYEELLVGQNGACAICRHPPKTGRLHVDHCHKSGVVRALLCQGCNTAIAQLKDCVETAILAAAYLEQWGNSSK